MSAEIISPHNTSPQGETGFVLVDDNSMLKEFCLENIAQNAGLIRRQVGISEVSNLYLSAFRNEITPTIFSQKFFKPDTSSEQTFFQQMNRLTNECTHMSYGVFAPSYYQELSSYKKESKKTEHCRSLLIGALTVDTLQEFHVVSNSVFENSENIAIDLDISGLKGHKGCIKMNGIDTSFANSTFDTVQTNSLLYQLEDPRAPFSGDVIREKLVTSLFKEMFRILKTDGKLIMIEGDYEGYGLKINSDYFRKKLSDAGFSYVHIDYAKRFSDMSDIIRLVRCSRKNVSLLENADTENCYNTLILTARKRNYW